MSAHEHKNEVSHPVLWTAAMLIFTVGMAIWFAYWMHKGWTHGQLHPHTKDDSGFIAAIPDHAALIKDDSAEVIAKGKSIYLANCVTCHAADGGAPVAPPARNFNEEPFGNEEHGAKSHPWSMYHTLTTGFKQMTAQPQLSVEERYAVIHYIRETFVKTNNAGQYVTKEEALTADFPSPREASGEQEMGTHPKHMPISVPVYAVLKKNSEAAVAIEKESAWLSTIPTTASSKAVENALTALRGFAGTQAGAEINKSVVAKNPDSLTAFLLKPEIASLEPAFGTLSKQEFSQLYTVLTAGRK